MIYVSIVFFLIALFLGLLLLSYILRKKETPKGLALIHAFFAVLGVITLFIASILHSDHGYLWMSLAIFIVAAMGGVYLFLKDIFGHEIPKWIAVVHGLIALSAFILLLYATY